LLELLATQDTLASLLGRQYAYLTLRAQIDSRDSTAQTEMSALSAAAQPVLLDIGRELASLSAAQLAAFVRAEPRLARYEYAIGLARDQAAHPLSGDAQRTLGFTVAEATSWGPSLFRRMLAETPGGKVHAPEGDLDLRSQMNQIRNHPDRSVRAEGYRLNQAAIASRRDTFALILSRQAAMRNALARVRSWPDYPTQMYASSALTPPEVRSLLTAVLRRAEINKTYERSRIAELKKTLGYDTVHYWDLSAPDRGAPAPRFTIQQASGHILAAVEPLGPSYVAEMAKLLDPANGRLDLVPRPNRAEQPGFSTGSVGYPSMFFQARFEGFGDDLVILVHEAGHAVQNMLMDSAGVLPRYATGPSFFTESFATMNELILLEYLARESPDSAERRYFRRQLLENAIGLFRSAHESLLELQIFDSVAAGRMLSADAVEALTQRTGAVYSVWYGPGTEHELAWVQPIQFYTWPLYRANYVLAKLLALRYLDQLHRDPPAFRGRYLQLLRNGYDAPPDVLLRRFMNIDLRDGASLVDGAVRVIVDWMSQG
jgi:oligoendopeptidase F